MFNTDAQRKVTRIALETLASYGFALAGSGAIREHGLTERPTEDIDLFTVAQYKDVFHEAVAHLIDTFTHSGIESRLARHAQSFARVELTMRNDEPLYVDLALDWRQFPPVELEIGLVLSLADSVASKMSALYSRAEPRDYLDIDSIRGSSKYTDDELLTLASNFDPGFDRDMFTSRIAAFSQVPYKAVEVYGLTQSAFDKVQERFNTWVHELSRQDPTDTGG